MRPRKRKRPARVRARSAAAVEDVLGTKRAAPISGKWRTHYRRLEELRRAFLERQSAATRAALEEQPTFSTHMADAGTDEYDRDFALGMLSSEQDALYQIEQAMERIRNGTYGICEVTGKRIEPGRLEAIPWTRFSVEAEARLEKDGLDRRTRLGPRESVARSSPNETAEDLD